MSDQNTALVHDFVTEAREHLASIEPDLLVMERQGTDVAPEVVRRIFRAIHSTKGGASFLAFEALKRFSHVMEGVLAQIRDGHLPIDAAVIDALLRGVDVLRAMVDDISHCESVPHAAELSALQALLGEDPVPAEAQAGHARSPAGEADSALAGFDVAPAVLATCLARGMRLYRAEMVPTRDIPPAETVKRVDAVGQHLAMVESSDSDTEAPRRLHLCATVLDADLLAGELGISAERVRPVATDALRAELRQLGIGTVPSGSRADPASPAAHLPRAAPDPGAEARDTRDTLRVRVDLLDRLMNAAGELVLGRNQLLRRLEGMTESLPGLTTVLQHIDRVTTELQDGIMQTRMQPVGLLFARFPRVARDLAQTLGKQVDVDLVGEGVEIDKSLIEALADPLTHLVRNAISHGLEPPTQRIAAGKAPRGRIALRAFHESGQVTLLVSDDGRGVDRDAVVRRALERGLLDEHAASALLPQDVMELAFTPGFSTAQAVSELSGRGVGLDVVRTNVERLGGKVAIETEPGLGTTVVLRLPLTLAIIPSLIVGASGARFAVPQASIVELVWVRAEQAVDRIETIADAPVLRLRGRLLPLVRLADVLDMQRHYVDPATQAEVPDRRERVADRRDERRPGEGRRAHSSSDYHILVLRVGVNRFGLIVNDLFESEEIVVKPLPAYVKHIDCFAGTTILGDGTVTMILEPSGIAARHDLQFASLAQEESRRRSDEARERRHDTRRRAVIVFDGAPDERFAVPQEMVLRVERINTNELRRLGGREYVQRRGGGLPVRRLDSVLPVSCVPADSDEAFLLIPRAAAGTSAALLVWRIVDALEIAADLEAPLFGGPGLLGSALIEGQLVTVLDPAGVIEATSTGGAP